MIRETICLDASIWKGKNSKYIPFYTIRLSNKPNQIVFLLFLKSLFMDKHNIYVQVSYINVSRWAIIQVLRGTVKMTTAKI